MAIRKINTPTTLAGRLAEIDELLATNAAETGRAAARLAKDPADGRALKQLEDLEAERGKLEGQRRALERAQRAAAEQGRRADLEAEAQRLRDLRAQLDELLKKRGEAASAIGDALDVLGARLMAYETLQQDVAGIVGALRRASGREVIRFPLHVDARTVEASLLDRLWRSGLGRTGFRFWNRVTVEPAFALGGGRAQPIAEAHEADVAKLLEGVDRLLEAPAKPAAPATPIHEAIEQSRRREHAAVTGSLPSGDLPPAA